MLAYLDLKKSSLAPRTSWLIEVMLVQNISAEATHTFTSLEGLKKMVSQQREELHHLHGVYVRLFNAHFPSYHEDADMVYLEFAVVSEDDLYFLKLYDGRAVQEDLSWFVSEKIEETGADLMIGLIKDLAVCTGNIFAGVSSVVAERNSSNKAASEMSSVCFEVESSSTL